MSAASTTKTAADILEVAEAMFSESGYRAVSLRSITRRCEANIAAVHYHFGSKEILLDRIFEQRSAAINDERLRLLLPVARQRAARAWSSRS